jgi:hypothetical protein
MLNDFPDGFNARENAFGMFRGDGSAKPIVATFRELTELASRSQPGPQRPADYPVVEGRFFTQASGRPPARDPSGFLVSNGEDMPFLDTWRRLGVEQVGYPLSRRFIWRGAPTQVFQKSVLQWRQGEGVTVASLMDELHRRGHDPWLESGKRIPSVTEPMTAAAAGQEALGPRQAVLDANAALRERYYRAPEPLLSFGLPTSRVTDLGDALAVRTQRAVLVQWKADGPHGPAGTVTVAPGGEIAVELNLFPLSALVPEPPPLLPVTLISPATLGPAPQP